MSLTEYFGDTCRDGRWLEAESQTGALPRLPLMPSPSFRPQLSLSPSLLSLPPSPTQPSPSLSLHPHSLPLPQPLSIHSPPPNLRLPAFHLPTSLSPTPTPSAAPGLGKECGLCGLLETRHQNPEEPDQKNLCRAQGLFIGSTACPLLATLLVTGILGFLEASGRLCLLEGPMLPKGPALVFVPKVAGIHPVTMLSTPPRQLESSLLHDLRGSASEARRPERGSGEKVPLSFFSL